MKSLQLIAIILMLALFASSADEKEKAFMEFFKLTAIPTFRPEDLTTKSNLPTEPSTKNKLKTFEDIPSPYVNPTKAEWACVERAIYSKNPEDTEAAFILAATKPGVYEVSKCYARNDTSGNDISTWAGWSYYWIVLAVIIPIILLICLIKLCKCCCFICKSNDNSLVK